MFHDFVPEAAKAFVAYSEELQDRFFKRPYDTNLVFFS